MSTQTTTRMTIQEAVKFYGKTEKTIRRWIKEGKVTAAKEAGKWYVYPDEQDIVSPDVQPDVQGGEVDQLRSENEYLRERLVSRDQEVDQLTKLLAMEKQEKTLMLERLPSPEEHPNENNKRVFGFLDNIFKRA